MPVDAPQSQRGQLFSSLFLLRWLPMMNDGKQNSTKAIIRVSSICHIYISEHRLAAILSFLQERQIGEEEEVYIH